MYNILICDDEKDIVSALKIYLKTSGYNIYEAYNGKEALERIKEHDIHLVLMDIMMPEMDGITAMLKIREETNLPVILLTAKSEDTDKILGGDRQSEIAASKIYAAWKRTDQERCNRDRGN